MTDSICTFINPKAMRQLQGQKQLQQENQAIEEREQIQKIQQESKEKIMIENTADDLFAALKKKDYVDAVDKHKQIDKFLAKAFEEDEHDYIVREYEEYLFCKQLRIKKENTRRAKILHQKKLSQVMIIDVPRHLSKEDLPKGIQVGFEQVVTIGNDVDVDLKFAEKNQGNTYFVDGIDYSEIVQITSFSLLKNRELLFKQIVSESDEETIKWIDQYIEEDKEQTETVTKIRDIIQGSTGDSAQDRILNARERILTGKTVETFDGRRKNMLKQMGQDSNDDVDEISFVGGKNAR
jgi:hypothetical protein